MKSQLLLICAFLILYSPPVFGQSSGDLRAKYGTPVKETFRVRPGIVITVEYASDGRICEMVLERGATESDGPATFSEKLARELVDELVPADERGDKSKFYGLTLWTGQEGQTNFNYENVSIHYFVMQQKLFIEWQNRGCQRRDAPRSRQSNNSLDRTRN